VVLASRWCSCACHLVFVPSVVWVIWYWRVPYSQTARPLSLISVVSVVHIYVILLVGVRTRPTARTSVVGSAATAALRHVRCSNLMYAPINFKVRALGDDTPWRMASHLLVCISSSMKHETVCGDTYTTQKIYIYADTKPR
jgi:hypothetical protein